MPEPTVGPAPGKADRRLICAALGNREVAQAAWASWVEEVTLDAAPPEAFAVLPAVSRNLDRLEIETPEVARLRGIYRYAWTQCQLTLHDLFEVSEALAEAGVRSVAHRGIPPVARVLGDAASVFVDQTDLLIDPEDLDAAAGILRELGWSAPRPIPPTSVRSAFAWIPFENTERRRVALHWRSFPAGSPHDCDSAIVRRAVEWTHKDRRVLVPEVTDHLLLLCLRAPLLPPVERERWVLEIGGLLNDAETPVDEDALQERARTAGVLEDVAAVLRPLDDFFSEGPPGLRVPRLPNAPGDPTVGPRVPSRPRNMVERTRAAARGALDRHAAWCRRHGKTRTPWGFLDFTIRCYAYEWGAGDARGLAKAAVRRWRQHPEDLAPGRS